MTKPKAAFGYGLVHRSGDPLIVEQIYSLAKDAEEEKSTHPNFWKHFRIRKVKISVVESKKRGKRS